MAARKSPQQDDCTPGEPDRGRDADDCLSDIVLSDALGWGLTRTQLADGCNHRDFRFKKNGATRIRSKTPEVQETIERIARRAPR